ncbi:MAG: phosphoglycerate mutase [Pseudomonadota bacterium]|nr:phosphoglycerate mutase [Pseudomonadota bacterium]
MPPVPPLRHLLIAHAQPLPGQPTPPLPDLPHLNALFKQLRPRQRLEPDDDSPATAHELATAAACGLPGAPHAIPWAAWATATTGTPCAWLSPVHLQLGLDHVLLIPPDALPLHEADSRALLAACAPLLAEDGLHVQHHTPGCWLATGAPLAQLRTRSPQRAASQRLTRAQLVQADDPARQRQLTRLMSELEMLLASHPVNTAREAAGLLPLNALWLHGAGQLDALPPDTGVAQAQHLGQGAALHDSAVRAAAWQAIDTELAAPLLATLHSGQPVCLTLSSPRRAITWQATPGWRQKITGLFGRQRLSDAREQL